MVHSTSLPCWDDGRRTLQTKRPVSLTDTFLIVSDPSSVESDERPWYPAWYSNVTLPKWSWPITLTTEMTAPDAWRNVQNKLFSVKFVMVVLVQLRCKISSSV